MGTEKPITRRSALLFAAAPFGSKRRFPWKIGLFNASTGIYDASLFRIAKKAGFDGVEFQIVNAKAGLDLRKPGQCVALAGAARSAGLALPSITANYLNQQPIISDPAAAQRLAEAIAAAARLGAKVILAPCTRTNEIREEDRPGFERACAVLREVAPVAGKAGVTLAIENSLRAEENLRLLDRIGSDHVRLYFDTGIMGRAGRDLPREVLLLKGGIAQVHVQDALPHPAGGARGRVILSETGLPVGAILEALDRIAYTGWLVLETQMLDGVEEGLRANVRFVRNSYPRVGSTR